MKKYLIFNLLIIMSCIPFALIASIHRYSMQDLEGTILFYSLLILHLIIHILFSWKYLNKKIYIPFGFVVFVITYGLLFLVYKIQLYLYIPILLIYLGIFIFNNILWEIIRRIKW